MQSNKTTNVLLGLIAVVLIIGIGFFIKDQNTASTDTQSAAPTTGSSAMVPPPSQNSATPVVTPLPIASPTPGTKQYADAAFGFTVSYPQPYVLGSDASGNATFAVPGFTLPITIVKTTDTAPDSTGKWGPYTISYANGGYVVAQVDERTGNPETTPIAPIAYTTSGLPIFNGGMPTHGFGDYDYIVALSHTKFLTISGPDMPESAVSYAAATDPTLGIAQSITLQ